MGWPPCHDVRMVCDPVQFDSLSPLSMESLKCETGNLWIHCVQIRTTIAVKSSEENYHLMHSWTLQPPLMRFYCSDQISQAKNFGGFEWLEPPQGLPLDMQIPRHKALGGDQYSRAMSLQRHPVEKKHGTTVLLCCQRSGRYLNIEYVQHAQYY